MANTFMTKNEVDAFFAEFVEVYYGIIDKIKRDPKRSPQKQTIPKTSNNTIDECLPIDVRYKLSFSFDRFPWREGWVRILYKPTGLHATFIDPCDELIKMLLLAKIEEKAESIKLTNSPLWYEGME